MAKEVENPCVSICKLNAEMCVSCGRLRQEIKKWKKMKRPEKKEVVELAKQRLKALKKKDR